MPVTQAHRNRLYKQNTPPHPVDSIRDMDTWCGVCIVGILFKCDTLHDIVAHDCCRLGPTRTHVKEANWDFWTHGDVDLSHPWCDSELASCLHMYFLYLFLGVVIWDVRSEILPSCMSTVVAIFIETGAIRGDVSVHCTNLYHWHKPWRKCWDFPQLKFHDRLSPRLSWLLWKTGSG